GHTTIEPGAHIVFDPGAGVTVRGARLTAVGTEADPIRMRSRTPWAAAWKGVHIAERAGGTSTLPHAHLRGAGHSSWHPSPDPAGISVGEPSLAASADIRDCTIENIGVASDYPLGIVLCTAMDCDQVEINQDVCEVNTFIDIHGPVDCSLFPT